MNKKAKHCIWLISESFGMVFDNLQGYCRSRTESFFHHKKRHIQNQGKNFQSLPYAKLVYCSIANSRKSVSARTSQLLSEPSVAMITE